MKYAKSDLNFENCWVLRSSGRCYCMPQMTAAESLPSEASGADGVSTSGAESAHKAQQVAQDETSRDEKNDVGAEMEEKNESSSDAQPRSSHAGLEAFPKNFDDLCSQMTERAGFLLEVIPLS